MDLLIFNARLGNELVQSYKKTNEQASWPSDEISDTDKNFTGRNRPLWDDWGGKAEDMNKADKKCQETHPINL